MAVKDLTPFIMKNAIVQLGTDDYAKAVSSAVITPSGGTATFKGLKPDATFSYPQSTVWTLDLTFAQDWQEPDSLSAYLFAHQGENIAATVNPNDATAGTTSWALTVSIAPGSIGGDVDSVAVSTVSLGVVGQPDPTNTPPVASRAKS